MNRWKLAFWMLCAANGVILLAFIWLIAADVPVPADEKQPETGQASAQTAMTITASKADLNRTIEQFLQQYTDQHKVKYGVVIGDDIRLNGTVRIFRRDIELEIGFEPAVLDSGDLLLRTKEMRIGALPVPADKVLGYIRTYYDMPDWVEIAPADKHVIVLLSKMKPVGPFNARVAAFDPSADRFEFELYMGE